MELLKLFKLANPWTLVYEGEGDGGDGGQGGEGGSGDGDGGTGGGDGGNKGGEGEGDKNKNKTFTQEQVNKMLAEDRRKHKAQVDAHVAELERLKKLKGISDKDKADLQARIEELNNSVLTKEELARKNEEKIKGEHKRTVETLTTERDGWKKRYVDSTITRAITDEAVKAEAFSPSQIVALLKGSTRLAEVLDGEGNPVPDEFVAKVTLNDTDKEGKPVTLDLTVAEALKRMKDRTDEYGNLFKSGVSGGIGGSGNRGTGGKGFDPKTATPEQWQKHRQEMGLGRKKFRS